MIGVLHGVTLCRRVMSVNLHKIYDACTYVSYWYLFHLFPFFGDKVYQVYQYFTLYNIIISHKEDNF